MINKVLFVSMGGTCRAPSAQGILTRLLQDADYQSGIKVNCAATHNYHVGMAPDGRAQFVARKRNYDISANRVRLVTDADFREYDLILAMDWENLTYLRQNCPRNLQHRLELIMRYCNDYEEATIADPFYGGLEGFFKMVDYLSDACQGVFEKIASNRIKPHTA